MPVTKSTSALESVVNELFAELQARSNFQQFGLTPHSFAAILCQVGAKYLAADTSDAELRSFFQNLRVEELALARACAAGENRAWEIFLTRYRERLYGAALRIAHEQSAARELADTLYADLYGTTLREGERVSKLASYTGRGSLEGWLRTVLAQEYVNRYRRTRRLISLDQESEEGAQFAAPEPAAVPSKDNRLEAAIDEVLASLSSEDRTILATYYLDRRTLADIARLLRVHESTISRKLDKLTKSLRKQILAGLVRSGMSRRQAEEALTSDVRDLQLNIRRTLLQESAPVPFCERSGAEAERKKGPKVGLDP